ncbi:hypothetical protein Dsin_017528 [Dipteronia sinensis]|uniref:Uncharacterized protein n=1 Tax=Dipteronia sinensis TaxID=43782 RepID=A0AAE0AGI6_9ROSI|nr:hypothetical protein Dsin_017528 [Dipteronia sinensis]
MPDLGHDRDEPDPNPHQDFDFDPQMEENLPKQSVPATQQFGLRPEVPIWDGDNGIPDTFIADEQERVEANDSYLSDGDEIHEPREVFTSPEDDSDLDRQDDVDTNTQGQNQWHCGAYRHMMIYHLVGFFHLHTNIPLAPTLLKVLPQRKFAHAHKCSLDTYESHFQKVSSIVIGEMFAKKLNTNGRTISPIDIIAEMCEQHGVQLLYTKAWRAKENVKIVLYGKPEDSYQLLPAYFHLLKVTNLGTLRQFTRMRTIISCMLSFHLVSALRGFRQLYVQSLPLMPLI